MGEIQDRTEGGPEPGKRRYGLLVIVEADNPRLARECVANPLLLGRSSAAGEGVWVGAPHEGVPLAAEEFGDESLALGFDLADGDSGRLRMSVELRSYS